MVKVNKTPPLSPGAAELYQKDRLTRWLHPMGDKLFRTPGNVSRYVDAKTANPDSLLRRFVINPVLKSTKWLTNKFLDYDYKSYIKVGKYQLSRPSPGAFAMMLFPFTIAPRLIQAIKRSENGDRSEFYDILRRDIPTIAILLYALDPLQKFLTQQMQKFSGVKLVGDEILQAREATLNYAVDSEKALAAILREKGNTPEALRKALDNVAERWINNAQANTETVAQVNKLKETVEKMIEAHGKGKAGAAQVDKYSAQAFKLIEGLERWKTNKLAGLAEASQKEITNAFPSIKEFFARYAHTRRLPVDIVSFILVCVGIGWLPVWFNDLWNRKKFAEKEAAHRAEQVSNFDAALAYQALKQRSNLRPSFNVYS